MRINKAKRCDLVRDGCQHSLYFANRTDLWCISSLPWGLGYFLKLRFGYSLKSKFTIYRSFQRICVFYFFFFLVNGSKSAY